MAPALVVFATAYMALLCFINTTWGGAARFVSLVDGAVIVSAMILALQGQTPRLLVPLMVIAVNFLLLGVVIGGLNIKAVRDVLAPLAFLALGWRYGTMDGAKRAFYAISVLVVAFGIFEYALKADYVRYFNVLQFYIDRGVLNEESARYTTDSLFVSGTRGAARNMLPFLGQHRVASIFLEPVSMGNFGAIAAAFALSLGAREQRAAWVAAIIAAFAVIMADARFGAVTVILMVVTRFTVPRRWTAIAVLAAPIAAMALLFVMGSTGIGTGDDLPTRLAASGRALMAMDIVQLLGAGREPLLTQDSGYYYALRSFGLVFCVVAWIAFAASPAPGSQSRRFKLLMGLYMALLLCVSGASLFALKTSALCFFLVGALAAADGAPWRAPARHVRLDAAAQPA
jgi:putative polymerase